jgi:hypothetical protein
MDHDDSVCLATRYGLNGPGIGLRRGSASVLLLGLGVRMPPGAWMFVLSIVNEDRRQTAGHSSQRHKFK